VVQIFKEKPVSGWNQYRWLRELHDACKTDASGKGTFNRGMQGLALMKKHKVDYNILCTVMVGIPALIYVFVALYGAFTGKGWGIGIL
jgi:hypothetical protein